ncbi:hypothetical protein ACF0H5_012909 [Mactra antiquata]
MLTTELKYASCRNQFKSASDRKRFHLDLYYRFSSQNNAAGNNYQKQEQENYVVTGKQLTPYTDIEQQCENIWTIVDALKSPITNTVEQSICHHLDQLTINYLK